ncbi:MAG: hypothetical protein ACK44C_01365 [Polaromonas sp.]|jgi:hypothetical protein
MTKDREALKLALEALQYSPWTYWRTAKAIDAIQQALAQPPLPVQPQVEDAIEAKLKEKNNG